MRLAALFNPGDVSMSLGKKLITFRPFSIKVQIWVGELLGGDEGIRQGMQKLNSMISHPDKSKAEYLTLLCELGYRLLDKDSKKYFPSY